jgi:N-acetylmuramoyl-L-alanine amidase
MPYTITEKLLPIGMNRPGTLIKVRGIVSHRTGNTNAGTDALAHYGFFAGGNRNASAHYFVDSGNILRIIPEDEMSWHAGLITSKAWTLGNPNTWAIGVELCENFPFMSPEGDAAYRKYVWLHADICRRRNLEPRKDIHGHFMIDPVNRGEDPKGLFNWGMFIDDVARELAAIKEEAEPETLASLKEQNRELQIKLAAMQAEKDNWKGGIKKVQEIVSKF